MKKQMSMVLAVMMLVTALLTGCADSATTGPKAETPSDTVAVTGGGTLTLSVNPEIRLDYDENGMVTAVVADNKDGEAVLSAVDEPVGMNVTQAVEMLVREIEAQGYFVDETEDEKRMVMLQFKADSVMPSDRFLSDVTDGVQQAVKASGADNAVVTIGTQDYDKSFTSGDYITQAKAEEIARSYVGVSADNAVFDEREFDLDHGVAVYELEFTADGTEYEIDVDAVSGTVLKAKQKEEDNDEEESIPEGTYITYEQAADAALSYVGVTRQEAVFDDDRGLDKEDGLVVYELEFVVGGTEYELEINAETGDVVDTDQEDEDDDRDGDDDHDEDDVPPVEDASYIGVEKAKEIALGDAGVNTADVHFDDVELDRKKGAVVYDVEFEVNGVEYDYHIDAVSGEILKSEHD